MGILDFKEANCRNCYKCLRNCPVKAISFKADNAQVIDEKCILCGKCVSVCPQHAKFVKSDLERAKEIVAAGGNVVASVAPSYISSFNVTREVLFSALALLGFTDVQGTAVGAKYVTEKYSELLKTGKYKNFITSACPAVVRMAQYDYHAALKYVAPVDSPMVAHAKIIKEKYGEDTAVIFIGPCIAKKREAEESGVVNLALTFEELELWFAERGISLDKVEIDEKYTDYFRDKSLYYPISRGIIKSFYEYEDNYDYVYVDGVERCAEVLANIDNLDGMVIEMSACENSCVNGPCALASSGGFLKANEQVRKYARNNSAPSSELETKADISAERAAKGSKISMPSEREIADILAAIGKTRSEDMLNCGACGYDTCREKAIAVYNGMASLNMCLPYMRERAESISSEMFANSPNAVIAVNQELIVQEINEEARSFFGIAEKNVKGRELVDFINPTEFLLAQSGERIINKKIRSENTGKWGQMSIYKVARHDMLICTVIDITRDVQNEERMRKVRLETAETTQKVIEKQMNIVQEIASLLGETTADTKVALIKLKNAVMQDEKE